MKININLDNPIIPISIMLFGYMANGANFGANLINSMQWVQIYYAIGLIFVGTLFVLAAAMYIISNYVKHYKSCPKGFIENTIIAITSSLTGGLIAVLLGFVTFIKLALLIWLCSYAMDNIDSKITLISQLSANAIVAVVSIIALSIVQKKWFTNQQKQK